MHIWQAKPPNIDAIYSQVLVLGAGASGIHAAKALLEHGVDVTILEARTDALGGRVKTAEFPRGSGYVVEAGANWIEGAGGPLMNPVLPLAMKAALVAPLCNYSDVIYRESYQQALNRTVFSLRCDEFNAAFERVQHESEERRNRSKFDISVRQALDFVNWTRMSAMDDVIEYFKWDFKEAENAETSSLKWAAPWHTFADFGDINYFSTDQRGFKTILEETAMEAGIGFGSDRLHLGKQVTHVHWSDNNTANYAHHNSYNHHYNDGHQNFPDESGQVFVTCSDGSVYTASHVIITFSIGVLKFGQVKFEAELPAWKRRALDSFHMPAYTKIFVEFETQFWDKEQFILYGAWGGASLTESTTRRRGVNYPVWQNLNADAYLHDGPFGGTAGERSGKSAILMATVTGLESERVEALTDNQVLDEVMHVLRDMYGPEIPRARSIFVSRWLTDPFTRGSYSSWNVGFDATTHADLKAPVATRLWFTGEACSEQYFGYIHGAIIEGNKTGHAVAAVVHEMRKMSDVGIEKQDDG
ncbi:amine oxidase [Chytriomyces cf. hyalinus JEL632]|nr:amine oxidase [Chytriomyces cf. hyalinus JEL632]